MKSKIKIIVISDTHGNKAILQKVIKVIQKEKADFVYHLGDYYDDAQAIIDLDIPCVRVPGTWTAYYQNYRIENRKIEFVYDWKIFLSHTPTQHYNDLPDDEDPLGVIKFKKADLLLHGHTHQYAIYEENDVLIVNPGHLKAEFDRGQPATYATLTIAQASIDVLITDLYKSKTLKTFVKYK